MATAAERRTAAADPESTFEAAVLPRVRRHARVAFRHPGAEAKEEATAEAVALAWGWYLRLVRRGKDVRRFPSAVATFAARQVRCGRRLTGQEAGQDVLSPLAQRRHGFRTRPLTAGDARASSDPLADRLRDNTVTPPPDQAAFRIDYPAWLARLRERDRRIARDMAAGETTQALARQHAVSAGRVSQLRRELHADWRRFHGEPAG